MDEKEYMRLQNQLATLKEVAEEYPCKTIENVIVQITTRLNEICKSVTEQ